MADDNNIQNRMSNPTGRTAAPSGEGPDPLAELARLIGQNDPYSDFGRDPRAPAPQRPMSNDQQLVGQPHADPRAQQIPGAYPTAQNAPAFDQASHDFGGHQDSHMLPAGSDIYDEAESGGRSRGFVTAVAVIVLAAVGTAGAVGYRYVFSGSGSTTPPPVIRANTDPTRVPPPAGNSDSTPGKLTYERVGGNQGERMVPREEQPVDPKDLSRPNVTRNSPPSSPPNQWAGAVAPNLPTNTPTSSVVQPSTSLGEPKKVRTVPIRPITTEANMAPSSMSPPNSPANVNMQNSRSAPAAAPTFVAPPPRATAGSNQTAPLANAPLALNDDNAAPVMPRTNMAPPPPAPQARQAPAPKPAPAPQQLAAAPRQAPAEAAPPASAGGGYLVQVSSQRSEAEAQTALRGLQSKFPNVVGGQPSTVRRAEVADRGTFYRAMIGPFASRDQANQLCTNLKAAGGTCIVAGN